MSTLKTSKKKKCSQHAEDGGSGASQKPKMGRPSTYTQELGDYVCDIISTHPHGLNKLNRMYDRFPESTVIYSWLTKFDNFRQQYFEARREQANVLADSMLEITDLLPTYMDKDGTEKIDAGMLGRAKLEMEIKKWHASKIAPKIWGDAKQIEDTQAENRLLKDELHQLRAQLAQNAKAEY